MSRRIACWLTVVLVLSVYWLRGTPVLLPIILIAALVTEATGKTLWKRRNLRWLLAMSGTCIAWCVMRIGFGTAARSLVIGEVFMLLLASELVRTRDDRRISPGIPLFAAAGLAGAMEQRIAFESLGLFSLFGVLVVVSLGWMAAQARFRTGFTAKRISVTLAILGISGFSAFKVTKAWGDELSRLENQIDVLLANLIDDEIPSLYPRGGTLNSITAERITDPEAMAIRVYAERAPGYLTGRVFDSYNGRLWRLMSPSIRAANGQERFRQLRPTTDPRVEVPRGQSLFRLSGASTRKLTAYEMQNARGRGEMVFTPRGAQLVRGQGESARVDDFGVIHFGIYSESTYYVYTDPLAEAPIPSYQRSLLRSVPAQVRSRLGSIADQIASENQTFDDRVAGVVAYLEDGFQYATRAPRAPRRTDPLVHFALVTKTGHCEFFASTAVMLLRMQGISARYVTGYVCDERDPDDPDYWIARNGNCHAWAEAWDPAKRRWILVETTPGMESASLIAEEALTASEDDAGDDDDGSRNAGAAGFGAEAWLSGLQWGGFIAAAVLLGVAWYKYSDRGRSNQLAYAAITRVDRRLAKHELTRNSGETLHEFADRVAARSQGADDLFSQAARFYRQYASLLYGGKRDQMTTLIDLPTARA